MNIKQIVVTTSLVLGLALGANAQSFTTGIASYEGTLLKDSQNNAWTDYTIQVGVFTSPLRNDGGYWFGWNGSGANDGFTEIFQSTGTLGTGGLLQLNQDGYFKTFSNTLPDAVYSSVMGLAPSIVFSRAATGGTREVLVANFTSALLGSDPDSVETENIFGLTNEEDSTTFNPAYTGSASGSGANTVLSSASVPEPSSASLLLLGAAGLVALRRFKKKI
jgi:PEP-CTERM motif